MENENPFMTDNEIIKALECCNSEKESLCFECPYHLCSPACLTRRNTDIIDLINRQKAEIEALTEKLNATIAGQETLQKALAEKQAENERLKNECFCISNERDAITDCLNDAAEEARAEAIKEFAEKVTYCKDCARYELMTSNNQYFCNQFGGYVTETDCCSRGVPCKRNGG